MKDGSTTAPNQLAILRDAVHYPTLLVDFSDFTTAPKLTELLGSHLPDHGLYRLDGVHAYATAVPPATIEKLGTMCADELVRRQLCPVVIIGYCSAATLALDIADRLRTHSELDPAIILIDPAFVTRTEIERNLRAIRESLDADLDHAPPRLESVTDVLLVLRGDLTRHFRSQKVPDEEIELCVDLMLRRYEHWFGFLFESMRTLPPAPSRVDLVLSSAASSALPPNWTSVGVESHQFDLPIADLLASPSLAERLGSLIVQRATTAEGQS